MTFHIIPERLGNIFSLRQNTDVFRYILSDLGQQQRIMGAAQYDGINHVVLGQKAVYMTLDKEIGTLAPGFCPYVTMILNPPMTLSERSAIRIQPLIKTIVEPYKSSWRNPFEHSDPMDLRLPTVLPLL